MLMASARRIPVPLPRCNRLILKRVAGIRQSIARFKGHVLASILLLNACSPLAPAAAPAQLQHTPGPFFRITETRFDAGLFRLEYPSTWRVVLLSPADSPRIRVVFVAPDQSAVSIAQVLSAEAAADDSLLHLGGGVALRIEIQAAEGAAQSFFLRAENLINSIRA